MEKREEIGEEVSWRMSQMMRGKRRKSVTASVPFGMVIVDESVANLMENEHEEPAFGSSGVGFCGFNADE